MQNSNDNNHEVLTEFYKAAFKGRSDVVARYWKSRKGNSGYAPICANEWHQGICQKPGKSCRNCPNKDYVPLNDDLLIKHLDGGHILGVYPLLADNTCRFIAFDFDNHDGARDPLRDVREFYSVCEVKEIQCYVLRSKSGTGYHCYLFFDAPVPAWKARLVGFALLQEAQVVGDNVTISSFDKMFPSQDELAPTRPLGNLIGMPFQGNAAKDGHTLFLNPGTDFQEIFPDQLEALKSISRVTEAKLNQVIQDWGLTKESPQQQKPLKSKAAAKLFNSATKEKISQGSRNATLASEAGSLRRHGKEYEEIKEALLTMNQNQCEPPLAVSEVERIARSISSYPAVSEADDQEKILASAKETLAGLVDKIKSDPAAAFETSILAALEVIRENDPCEWARLRKMFQEAKVPMRDLTKAIKKFRAKARTIDDANGDGQSVPTHPYCHHDGVLTLRRRTPDGVVLKPLCNFNAYLVGEKVYDNGAEQKVFYKVSGMRQNGSPLPPIEVMASQFDNMSWVSGWGAEAFLNAGQSIKDHTRAAIRTLSGEVPKEMIFGHLGWRKLDGEWIYLHCGGGIGKNGFVSGTSVRLGEGRFNEYGLPEPPTREQLKSAVQASLLFLKLVPASIAYPLIGGVYRAPLGEIVPIDFSMFLAGPSGSQKSELEAQMQAHYGSGFHRMNLPANWNGTSNAIEKMAFIAKDSILTIDDFVPTGTLNEVKGMHSKADRVLRGAGNRSGRQRMNPDGSLRPEYYPRGLVLSSGEDIPKGHSLRGRVLVVEISRGNVDLEILTQVQHDAAEGLLAQSMSGYLQWLASRFDDLKRDLPDQHLTYRTEARKELRYAHDRTPETVASLTVGLSIFLNFAVDVGAITTEEAMRYAAEGWAALIEAGKSQSLHQGSEDVVNQFLRLVSAAINSGAAHLAHVKANGRPAEAASWGWRPNGQFEEYVPVGMRIGWIDDQNIYLDPDSAFAAVQKLANAQGTSLPVTQETLWKRLGEKGYLASNEPGRNTVRRMIAGKRPRVIHLNRSTLSGGDNSTVPDSIWEQDFLGDPGSWTEDLAQESENTEKVVH
jgi:hypothetical protein